MIRSIAGTYLDSSPNPKPNNPMLYIVKIETIVNLTRRLEFSLFVRPGVFFLFLVSSGDCKRIFPQSVLPLIQKGKSWTS